MNYLTPKVWTDYNYRKVDVQPQKVYGDVPLTLPMVKMSVADAWELRHVLPDYIKDRPLDQDTFWNVDLSQQGMFGLGAVRQVARKTQQTSRPTAAQVTAQRKADAANVAAQRKADADAKRQAAQQARIDACAANSGTWNPSTNRCDMPSKKPVKPTTPTTTCPTGQTMDPVTGVCTPSVTPPGTPTVGPATCQAGYTFNENGQCVPVPTSGQQMYPTCQSGYTNDPATGQCIPYSGGNYGLPPVQPQAPLAPPAQTYAPPPPPAPMSYGGGGGVSASMPPPPPSYDPRMQSQQFNESASQFAPSVPDQSQYDMTPTTTDDDKATADDASGVALTTMAESASEAFKKAFGMQGMGCGPCAMLLGLDNLGGKKGDKPAKKDKTPDYITAQTTPGISSSTMYGVGALAVVGVLAAGAFFLMSRGKKKETPPADDRPMRRNRARRLARRLAQMGY